MVAWRNIIRGTFRLSIVAAVLGAAYGAYQSWQRTNTYFEEKYALLIPLECGARQPPESLKPFENEFGLVDLSKVHCAADQFFASYEELQKARTGEMKDGIRREAPPTFDAKAVATNALIAFLVVNVLGLALAGVIAVLRWITDGFKSKA